VPTKEFWRSPSQILQHSGALRLNFVIINWDHPKSQYLFINTSIKVINLKSACIYVGQLEQIGHK